MSLILLMAGGSESETKTLTLFYSTANATLKASAMPSMQNVIFQAAKQVRNHCWWWWETIAGGSGEPSLMVVGNHHWW